MVTPSQGLGDDHVDRRCTDLDVCIVAHERSQLSWTPTPTPGMPRKRAVDQSHVQVAGERLTAGLSASMVGIPVVVVGRVLRARVLTALKPQ